MNGDSVVIFVNNIRLNRPDEVAFGNIDLRLNSEDFENLTETSCQT